MMAWMLFYDTYLCIFISFFFYTIQMVNMFVYKMIFSDAPFVIEIKQIHGTSWLLFFSFDRQELFFWNTHKKTKKTK